MQKFRFIGDPRDDFSGPDEIQVFGLSFNRKTWTEVLDPAIAAKLAKHSHFEAWAEAAPAPKPAAKTESKS